MQEGNRSNLVAAICMLLTLSGCKSAVRHFDIGGHRYSVPTEFVVNSGISWLPAPERESLLFRLSQSPNDDITVLVQPVEVDCPELNECRFANSIGIGGDQFEKVFSEEGNTQWKYVVRTDDSREIEAARCFKSGGRSAGLCSTLVLYGDLTLSIGYPDDKFADLPRFVHKAKAMLSQWEV